MLVLGLDLETTGLDFESDEIIEVGAAVWDTEQKKPLRVFSELVRPHQPVPEEITKITGISQDDIQSVGQAPEAVFKQLLDLADGCNYVVAHNGKDFDKRFLDKALKEFGMSLDLPWIDTMFDIPFPDSIKSRKLTHLCADHGFLNPFSHRAVFDVLSMFSVVSQYQFNEIEELYKSPQRKLIAKVSFEEKDKAKQAGFRWDPGQKHWYKTLKECQINATSFDFPTDILS